MTTQSIQGPIVDATRKIQSGTDQMTYRPVKILLIQVIAEDIDHVPGHLPLVLPTLTACALDLDYVAKLFRRLGLSTKQFEKYRRIPFEFRLVDFQVMPAEFDFVSYINDYQPQLVGIRTVSVSCHESDRIARVVRKALGPAVTIIYGGFHVSALPEETLLNNLGIVDFALTGETEETWPLFIFSWATGSTGLTEIPGLHFIDDNAQLKSIGPRPLVMSLDEYPSFTDYLHHLPYQNRYATLTEENVRGPVSSQMGLLLSSRGCKGRCNFCPTANYWNSNSIRFESPHKVLEKISVYTKRGYRIIYFRDDNFTENKARVKAICSGILERGWNIAWCCMSRVDSVDPELLLLMKQSGLAGIAFGVETGAEDLLKKMGKGASTLSARKANMMCRELNVRHKNYWMLGYPGETWMTIAKSALFMLDLTVGFGCLAEKQTVMNQQQYTHYLDMFTNDLIHGRNDVKRFLKENIEDGFNIPAGCNVAYSVPYPGSKLYGMLGKRVFFHTDQFRHGPAERRNLEDWESPVSTLDLSRGELTEARQLMTRIHASLKAGDRQGLEISLTKIIRHAQLKTSRSSADLTAEGHHDRWHDQQVKFLDRT